MTKEGSGTNPPARIVIKKDSVISHVPVPVPNDGVEGHPIHTDGFPEKGGQSDRRHVVGTIFPRPSTAYICRKNKSAGQNPTASDVKFRTLRRAVLSFIRLPEKNAPAVDLPTAAEPLRPPPKTASAKKSAFPPSSASSHAAYILRPLPHTV